jgi:hypothetical protein
MNRVVAYKDLVKSRVHWTKALRRANALSTSDLLDYAITTDVEHGFWIDEYRKAHDMAALEQVDLQLMQLQAIQEVLRNRAAK